MTAEFNKLAELVKYCYEGITQSDCEELVAALSNIKVKIKADELKKYLITDIECRIEKERKSSTQKIKEVLDQCTELSLFLQQGKVLESLCNSLDQGLVTRKLKNNPSFLLAILNLANEDGKDGKDDADKDEIIWNLFVDIVCTYSDEMNKQIIM
jgi:hypothetical protein